MRAGETGWLPDLLYRGGEFQSGVAFFADRSGTISRFSSAPEDCAAAQRLSNRAVVPAMVNAHSHAFQRTIRARTEYRTGESDSFWTWREMMYHAANQLSPEDLYDASRMAFLEMLLSGIGAAGEFHYLHHAPGGLRYQDPNLLGHAVIRAARDVGLRITLLRAAYARSGWRCEPNAGQARFITSDMNEFLADCEALQNDLAQSPDDGTAIGLAPHSIRAVPLRDLLPIADYARSKNLPLHMHAAEQPAELEACIAEHGVTPVTLLAEHGVLDRSFTAVHATHASPREVALLKDTGAGICVCPTTERNLGDGIAPAHSWRDGGIPICFGSDSNIQIDLLEDARELEYHLRLSTGTRAVLARMSDREDLARYLFDAATRGGAASLGMKGGRLQEGAPADFFTVDLNDPSVAGADAGSLLSHLVFSSGRPAVRDVYIAGRCFVSDGKHAEGEHIVERFTALQRRLWR